MAFVGFQDGKQVNDYLVRAISSKLFKSGIAEKVSKYGAFSGPYFPTFGPNTERYGSISPYSVRMRKNTDHKNLLRMWTLFTQCGSYELGVK